MLLPRLLYGSGHQLGGVNSSALIKSILDHNYLRNAEKEGLALIPKLYDFMVALSSGKNHFLTTEFVRRLK